MKMPKMMWSEQHCHGLFEYFGKNIFLPKDAPFDALQEYIKFILDS